MRDFNLLILASLVLFACGDDDGSSGSAGTAADVQAVCTTMCDRVQTCAPAEYTATCEAECVAEIVPALYVHDFFVAYGACMTDLACGTGDDICLLEAMGAVDPAWQSDPLASSCQLRYATCSRSFSDDVCGIAAALSPAGEDTLGACLDEGCAAISDCLDAAGF